MRTSRRGTGPTWKGATPTVIVVDEHTFTWQRWRKTSDRLTERFMRSGRRARWPHALRVKTTYHRRRR